MVPDEEIDGDAEQQADELKKLNGGSQKSWRRLTVIIINPVSDLPLTGLFVCRELRNGRLRLP
ncbi:hypothetical protein LL251_08895 [Sphingobium naphthae]|nr:hypothetical protein [Sphingobium naphthae]